MKDLTVSKMTVILALAELKLDHMETALAGAAIGVSTVNDYTSYEDLVTPFANWVGQGNTERAKALLNDMWPSVLLATWNNIKS